MNTLTGLSVAADFSVFNKAKEKVNRKVEHLKRIACNEDEFLIVIPSSFVNSTPLHQSFANYFFNKSAMALPMASPTFMYVLAFPP